MTLFVETSTESYDVFLSLSQMVEYDGGLAQEVVPGTLVISQVTYQKGSSSELTDRIEYLTAPTAINILVTAKKSPFDITLTDGTKISIDGGGATYRELTPAGYVLHIAYDMGQCNGKFTCVYDAAGNLIPSPNPVLLYHELAHAYHQLVGDMPTVPGDPAAETAAIEHQAIEDENDCRTELYPYYGLRDPNNHGGQCGGCGGDCLIVTAAYGELSEELSFMRTMRASHLGSNAFGRLFLQRFDEEYYTFSPHVSREMRRDAELRETIGHLLVGPLVNFLASALMLSKGEGHAEVIARLADDSRLLSARHLGWSAAQAASALGHLFDRERLSTEPAGNPLSADVPTTVITWLEGALDRRMTSHDYVDWAVILPAYCWWRARARIEAGCPSDEAAHSLEMDMWQWLTEIPIPPKFWETGDSEMTRALRAIAVHTLGRRWRQAFAYRLVASCPIALESRLINALHLADYPLP